MNKIHDLVYEKDIESYERIVKPKLNSGEVLNLFSSLTYITPNYINIYTLKQLADFAKKGFNIHLVILDMNSLSHKYSRNFHAVGDRNKNFIDARIQQVKQILASFGVDNDRLNIYKSSDLWNQVINVRDPPLFFEFYEILTEFKVDNVGTQYKLSHLIQMPMDIFLCNYLHIIHPEKLSKPIDVAFLWQNKKKIYSSVREKMYSKGLINMKKPILWIAEDIPYIIYQNAMPEWNMNVDEIINVVSGYSPSLEQSKKLFSTVLLDYSKEYILIANEKKSKVPYSSLIRKLSHLNENELYLTIAHNLYRYLKNVQTNITSEIKPQPIMTIASKREARCIGQILKSPIYLDIFLLSTGEYNLTQISKKLKKQISNVSIYVNNLKKLNLVEVNPQGKLQRTIKGIYFNLDVNLND